MELTVLSDLFDISKRLIVKKQTVLDYKLVRQLTSRGTKLKKTFISFGDTDLFKAFINIFNEEKYFLIFTSYSINNQIKDVARDTRLTSEIISELKSIKYDLPYTFRHILLVTALIIKMALDLKANDYDPQYAAFIGLVHDLGKSRIPKHILGKNSPLTQSEYGLLKTHPLLSYLLLCYYLGYSFNEISDAVRDHHERLDGSGYPRGLTKIGKYTRLIAPVDIFDALISERPYRSSTFTTRQALDYLIEDSNAGKIDKDVVYHLISYVRKEHPHPEELIPYQKKNYILPSDSSYGKIIPD